MRGISAIQFELPFDFESELDKVTFVDPVTIGPREYVFLEQFDDGLKKVGALLPVPEQSSHSYFIEYPLNDLKKVVAHIAASHSDGWGCVVFGAVPRADKYYLLEKYSDRVDFITDLSHAGYCNGLLEQYLRHFQAFITSGGSESDAFMCAAFKAGVAIYEEADSGLSRVESAKEFSREEALAVNRARIDAILR